MRARSVESPRISKKNELNSSSGSLPSRKVSDSSSVSLPSRKVSGKPKETPREAKLGSSLRERATKLHAPPQQSSLLHFYNCADDSLASDDISEITSERSCNSVSRSGLGIRSCTAASSFEPHPLSSRLHGKRKSITEKSTSDVSEDSSPVRVRSTSKSSPSSKGLSPELCYLLDFARGGLERLAAIRPEWRNFNKSLAASVESEVETHVKTCSKCRAFSSFSKHACGKKKAALNEHTLASLCKDQHKVLDEHIARALLQQKDRLLCTVSESLSIAFEDLLNYDAIYDIRLEPAFASLGTVLDERDRILEEAHMREDLSEVLAMMKYTRSAHRSWRAAASRFPHRKIDHERMSVVTYEDVEECALDQLHHLSTVLIKQMRDWETKWNPVAFQDVFCLFGSPLYENEYKLVGSDLDVSESIVSEGWQDIDEVPLTSEDVSMVRPMSVVVRIRPFLSHEAGDDITSAAMEDGTTVAFRDSGLPGSTRHQLIVDAAIEGDSQADFFTQSGVKALVHKVVQGSVATVFAYGQTGAGKTHSLLGPESCMLQLVDDDVLDPKNLLPAGCQTLVDAARRAKVCRQGLIPRAVQFLWKLLSSATEKSADRLSPRVGVKVSFLEVYNEKVFDLLRPDATQSLDVRQRSGNEVGFHVPDLSVVRCESPEAVLYELRQGVSARHTQGHSLSRDSSRAHAIFTIEMEPISGATHSLKGGKLVFADLAGSERPKRVQGAAAHETAAINKSLFALSNCISALAASGSDAPNSNTISSNFRSTKLTKLMMDSLTGSGYTLLVAAASPASRHADETAATFAFAAKCAHIRRKTAPTLTPHEREIQELQTVINSLREELVVARGGEGTASKGAALDAIERTELVEFSEDLQAENEKYARLMETEAANAAMRLNKLRDELAMEREKVLSLEERMQLEGTAAASQIERMCVQLDAERRRGRDLCHEAHAVNNASEEEIITLRTKLAQEQDRGASLQHEVQAVGRIAAAEIEELCKQLEAERRARKEHEHNWTTKLEAQRCDRNSEVEKLIDRLQEDHSSELNSALLALQEELSKERKARQSLSEKAQAIRTEGSAGEDSSLLSLRNELQEERCRSETLEKENANLRKQVASLPALVRNSGGENERGLPSAGNEAFVPDSINLLVEETCGSVRQPMELQCSEVLGSDCDNASGREASEPKNEFVESLQASDDDCHLNLDRRSSTGSQVTDSKNESVQASDDDYQLNLDRGSSAHYVPFSVPASPEEGISDRLCIQETDLCQNEEVSGSGCNSPAESTFSC